MPNGWSETLNRRVIGLLGVCQIIFFWEAFKALAAVALALFAGARLAGHASHFEAVLEQQLWTGLGMGVLAVVLLLTTRSLRGQGLHARNA